MSRHLEVYSFKTQWTRMFCACLPEQESILTPARNCEPDRDREVPEGLSNWRAGQVDRRNPLADALLRTRGPKWQGSEVADARKAGRKYALTESRKNSSGISLIASDLQPSTRQDQNVAIGFNGDPVPPLTGIGAAFTRNISSGSVSPPRRPAPPDRSYQRSACPLRPE